MRIMAERARIDPLELRLVDGLYYVLLAVVVVLAGWLAARHDRYWDWTQSRRNTLSEESMAILAALDAPLRITVFVDRNDAPGTGIARLLARYRRSKADLEVTFVDPQRFPEQARMANVSLLGQMLLEYRGRRETLSEPSEATLTAAIARIARDQAPWIAVLEGHGERGIEGEKAPELGRFAEILRGNGFRLQPLDLAITAAVPENAQLLLLSIPAISLFPGEADLLLGYLERGGNLLVLADPGDLGGLEPLMDRLGVEPLPGILVDANVAELNIEDPTVAMVADYPDHPLTRGLSEYSLFPGCVAFADRAADGWTLATPLKTRKYSWNDTGPIRGDVIREPDLGEMPGPLPVALALTRPAPQGAGEQRVLVLGDGDFLSNAYLDVGGNRALALHLIHWLTAPQGPVDLLTRIIADRDLALSRTQILLVGGGSLVVLPALFLITGLVIRWRRGKG
jgi:ABC-type uncharacterized transport system involved in gliding motility auxiliary subunit